MRNQLLTSSRPITKSKRCNAIWSCQPPLLALNPAHNSEFPRSFSQENSTGSAGAQAIRNYFTSRTQSFHPQNGCSNGHVFGKLPWPRANRPSHDHLGLFHHHRTFSTTTRVLKKKGTKQDAKLHKLEAAAERSETVGNDPYDFSTLNESIERIHSRLKEELSRLRPGGRFNPATIENLRVPLGKLKQADTGHGQGKLRQKLSSPAERRQAAAEAKSRAAKDKVETVRVADLAQVVPRGGRTVIMMLGDEKHVKPIVSALLNSGLNLNPQTSATNPLELQVPIPPPSFETRQRTLEEAARAGEKANGHVREARGAQQKTLRAMELAGRVRADDRHRAGQRMEEVVAKAYEEVKQMVDGARKVLGGISVEEARTKI